MLADHTAVSAGLSPPHACKQRSWEEQLGDLGSIERLSLASNSFRGRIPAELGNLTELWELHLHKTRLTGAIPLSLGDLHNLWILWLPERGLTGCIPDGLSYVEHSNVDHLGLPFCGDSEG